MSAGVPKRPWRALRFRLALGALALLSSSCGPHLPAARPLPHAENEDHPLREAAEVQVLEVIDHPTLQLVRREGDPAATLGVAIFPPRGSVDVAALGALLRLRLETRFPALKVVSHSLAIVLLFDFAAEAEVEQDLDAIAAALLEPVSDDEVERSQVLPLLERLAQRSAGVSPFDMCRAALGSEGAEAVRAGMPDEGASASKWLEDIRKSSMVASRVGLAAVGSGTVLSAAQQFQARSWPVGEPVIDAWDAGTAVDVGAAPGQRELLVALRVSDSERALAAARALRREDHPLHARLYAYSARFAVDQVDVTLRPAGACLSVRMSVDELSFKKQEEYLAGAALLVAHELEGAAEQSLTEDERALAIISPLTGGETAALAAWTAVRSATTGTAAKRIVEFRGARKDKISGAALLQSLSEVERSWSSREVPSVQAQERGQSQFWMMVASPCGTAPEENERAGLRALAVRTLAKNFSERRGVTLEPWISHAGIGLVAHSSAMRGETAAEHGARVARALGAALFGEAIDGRVVAQARSEQLALIGGDPGVALLGSVLGGEHAAMLHPLGTDLTVGAFATADVESARDDLVREPLRAAMLVNRDPKQADSASQALSSWLASAREHTTPCPTDALPSAAAPGMWTLQSIEEGVFEGDSIGLFHASRPVVGHAFAAYLNQLGKPWQASWSPAATVGGLVVRLQAAEERDRALNQARLELEALSKQELPEPVLKALLAEYARQEQERQRRPEGRLVGLWTGPTGPGPSAEEMRQLSKALAADQHRIVRVLRRK